MNVERAELITALRMMADNDPLAIAYKLVLDNRRMKELAKDRKFDDPELEVRIFAWLVDRGCCFGVL
jgi:hypothetical protein